MLETVSVVGLGKLGASIAAAIASRGSRVIGADVDQKCTQAINAGRAPVHETELDETIAVNRERLRATTDVQSVVSESDVTFIVVPTPSDERGSFMIDHAAAACRAVGRGLRAKDGYHLVVLTSTVMPGSVRGGLLPILERESGKTCGRDFGLCYSPEFVALGSVIRDFLSPDLVLIGEHDARAGRELEQWYGALLGTEVPCARMSLENAELAKLALNAYLCTKITFANMLSTLCEELPGGDVDAVSRALGLDERIGAKYLKAALGFGGPCLPRDTVALELLCRDLGAPAAIVTATDQMNRSRIEDLLARLQPFVRQGTRVGVLGLAFKPGSNVTEESQGLALARALAERGAIVSGFDPLADDAMRALAGPRIAIHGRLADCVAVADVVIVASPDPAFRRLSPADLRRGDPPVVVYDCWRFLADRLADEPGIRYLAVGRGAVSDGEDHRILSPRSVREE